MTAVIAVVRVALRAMSLLRIDVADRGGIAFRVLAWSKRVQVLRINARPISANVVRHHVQRHWPARNEKSDSGCLAIDPSEKEYSVPVTINLTVPHMAIANLFPLRIETLDLFLRGWLHCISLISNGTNSIHGAVQKLGELTMLWSLVGNIQGRQGPDGKAGSDSTVPGPKGDPGDVGRDAVAVRLLPGIEDAKAYPAGSWAVHAGGSWYAEQATEPLAGRSPQKAGWTPLAVGEAKCDIALADDLRTVVVTRTTSTGLTLERRFKIPTVLDRGVYTAGKQYERGDQVTRGGSYFIARVDKPSGVPGTPGADDWRMTIKGMK